MKALGTVAAVLAALVWSALIWGGYAVLLWSGEFLSRNAPGLGVPAEAASWLGVLNGLLQDYGTGVAAALWALGLLVILALRALYNWIVGMAGRARADDTPPPSVAAPAPVPAPAARPEIAMPAPTPPGPPAADVHRWGRRVGR